MRQFTLGDFDPELKKKPRPTGPHMECFGVEGDVVDHPFLEEGAVGYRKFQLDIAASSVGANTLVVLPTGLGKTIIAAMVAAEVLHHDMGKVVFLAPTKPLVEQHRETFSRLISGPATMQLFTGSVRPYKRKKLWDETTMVFATPQGILNDLEKGRYGFEDVGLVIFDEAHRAVGDYAYVGIAEFYREQRGEPLVLGLTASPGSDREKIGEVEFNLDIERIEARYEDDPDVSPYIQDVEMRYEEVELSTYMARARRAFEEGLEERVNKLKRLGFIRHRKKGQKVSKKDIIKAGDGIKGRIGRSDGKTRGMLFGALLNQTVALHISHCLELLETQGVEPTLAYLDRMRNEEDRKRATSSFLKNENVIRAYDHLTRHRGASHPKVDKALEVLKKQLSRDPDSLIIIFSQYRDTIAGLLETLRQAGYSAERFVGQAHKKGDAGLSQKEQAKVLDRFREREFNVLVASSVAEEGLDVPAVDMVIFYEPIPSAIRAIQRRGRTGRTSMGKVVILITKNTRDQGFLYAEMGRERKMKGIVRKMAGRR